MSTRVRNVQVHHLVQMMIIEKHNIKDIMEREGDLK